jgi:predicted Zn-dependent peptidase
MEKGLRVGSLLDNALQEPTTIESFLEGFSRPDYIRLVLCAPVIQLFNHLLSHLDHSATFKKLQVQQGEVLLKQSSTIRTVS